VSAIIYPFPERPRPTGACLLESFRQTRRSRSPKDYRLLIGRLMAAGVTGDGMIADVLNLGAIRTPQGTTWDGAAVRRLRRALGLVA
jgi:hypothetical protein